MKTTVPDISLPSLLESKSHTPLTVLLGVILLIFLRFAIIHVKFKRSELSAIPGPWYAPHTAIHLRYLFAQGTIWKYVERQHEKFGPVIRLGPRQIWVSEKHAVHDVLSKTDLPKVSMYAEISRDRHSPGLFGEM